VLTCLVKVILPQRLRGCAPRIDLSEIIHVLFESKQALPSCPDRSSQFDRCNASCPRYPPLRIQQASVDESISVDCGRMSFVQLGAATHTTAWLSDANTTHHPPPPLPSSSPAALLSGQWHPHHLTG
jgi:hypothetical protein